MSIRLATGPPVVVAAAVDVVAVSLTFPLYKKKLLPFHFVILILC